ncbi:helix-turn-helix domain-containing protein [Anaerorhabdus furcosa]|uniref:Transcriptional regulator, XRE family with cupin sensor n=1 Tax=Anaerorhabdus furcosa TaxID=118967 RepID=A0A1T4LYD5_9FIRM|nr:XRE family transcriptional regulator [Anaerorhabdus furcosa]SJZ59538.1 transcriptional regulator, XRE family with cupin sensor [Anaerorhabdus furcosa]
MDIGHRIKQLRTKNNLTLEELASRCELTKGFLSQLERNLTSPSIQTLEDIAEALGTTMAKFFQEEKDEKIVFGIDDYFVDERDGSIVNWIVPNAQKNEMEPILLELSENGESQLVLPHEGEEFGYVLSGRIRLIKGESKKGISIKKGETFYIKGNEQHYLKNDSTQSAKVLWICTPPIF